MVVRVKRRLRQVAAAILPLLLCLLLTEGAVRLLTVRSQHGQLYFQGGRLRPYKMPIARVSNNLEKYASRPDSYFMYHPRLGWAPRPGSVSDNGLYRSNSAGLRSDLELELVPSPGVLRIALFGDSYTHGDEVPLEQSWAFRLEALLAETGVAAEVLNFGVGGYGMDQAYLRWQLEGAKYRPDAVIFGFAPRNIARNLSVFRCIVSHYSNIPFSKPRFVLEGEELRLVNSPTLPLEELVPTLEDFQHSPLREYELFYAEDDYAEHWWLQSELLSVVSKELRGLGKKPIACRDIDQQPAKLTIAIVAAFAAEASASGARFHVAHLPSKIDLRTYGATGRFCYDDLLRYFDAHYPLIRVESYFTDPDVDRYFAGHYSAEGNELVATAVAERLRDMALTEVQGALSPVADRRRLADSPAASREGYR